MLISFQIIFIQLKCLLITRFFVVAPLFALLLKFRWRYTSNTNVWQCVTSMCIHTVKQTREIKHLSEKQDAKRKCSHKNQVIETYSLEWKISGMISTWQLITNIKCNLKSISRKLKKSMFFACGDSNDKPHQ